MKRKFLRKKIQEVLKGANIPGVGQDVFCRKSTPHEEQSLPYIIIYADSESSERFDEAPKRYRRNYQITCEIVSVHDTDEELCDELDDLSGMVESAIENDEVLQGWKPYDNDGNCLEDTEVVSVQYDQEGNGQQPSGSCRVSFNIEYIDAPITKKVLSPFKGLDTKWEIGDHGDNQAEDTIDLPQE